MVNDGFYKINLLPAITAKCRTMLDDIRLLDEEGKQVPYIIISGEAKFEQKYFEPFKKISEGTGADSNTKITI